MRDRARGPVLLVGLLALAAALPILTLVVRAFADVWRAPAVWPQQLGLRGVRYALSAGAGVPEAVWNGAVIALLATAGALMLGWPAARALAAASRRVRRPVMIAVALPLLVPQFAAGAGLAEWFIRLGVSDTLLAVAIAHLIYTLPYVVIVLAGAFSGELLELEEAAATVGAGPLRRLLLVSLPASRVPLATAAVLALLVSWSQYGTTLAIGGATTTLPVMLVPFAQSDPQIAATLSLLFLAPALLAFVALTRVVRA